MAELPLTQQLLTQRQQRPSDLASALQQFLQPTVGDVSNTAVARFSSGNPALSAQDTALKRIEPQLALVKQLNDERLMQMKQQMAMMGELPTGYRWGQNGAAEPIPGVDESYLRKADPFGMPIPVYNPVTKRTEFVPKGAALSGGYQPPNAEPTDTERLASGFADRMATANTLMSGYEQAGVNSADTWENIKESAPFVGNYLVSNDFQNLRQAQNNWIRANLRKESGAVIAAEEMEKERQTYFPMPGDKPEVIKQKAAARTITEEAMQRNAGQNYTPPTKPPQPSDGFDDLPDPAQYTGQTLRDQQTGQRLISNGTQWVPAR